MRMCGFPTISNSSTCDHYSFIVQTDQYEVNLERHQNQDPCFNRSGNQTRSALGRRLSKGYGSKEFLALFSPLPVCMVLETDTWVVTYFKASCLYAFFRSLSEASLSTPRTS